MSHSATAGIRPRAVLVGPMASGKSSVGRSLAARWQVELRDSDALIVERAGRSIPEIFATDGEAAFRDLEREVILEQLETFDGVLALGGGAVLDVATREALRGHTVVYLTVDERNARYRLRGDTSRPVLAGGGMETWRRVFDERRDLYEVVASVRVDTSHGTTGASATRIIDALVRAGIETAATTGGRRPLPTSHVVIPTPREMRDRVSGVATADAASTNETGTDMTVISVGDAYDVTIGRGVLGVVADAVPAGVARVLIVEQAPVRGVADAVSEAVAARGITVVREVVPDGEAAKSVEVSAHLWGVMARAGFTRSDIVIGVGGGAVTDLAGWVAASWLRGVGVIQVPTTVLAMVDAAVGGKTGINIAEGKNLVGAFHEPLAVVADLDTVATLPTADVAAGLAEVIKCGFIRDERILELVEADPGAALDVGGPVLAELVRRAVAVKAEVVAADLKESNLREILNYGHTFAHAIEQRENYTWRHGDAVAVGCVFAAELAHAAGVLDVQAVERQRQVLASVGLPTSYVGGDFDEMLTVMGRDKKTRGNTLRFVVLHAIGDVHRLEGPTPEQLRAAFDAVTG